MTIKPQFNPEQEAAILCRENAVVAAGAGSGKTLVLASRFARLVTEENYRVSEILTLTFTNKATAQMHRRIYAMLKEIAMTDSGDKGKRAQRALSEFSYARIQTLDSYSSSLLRQCASRYGVAPNFIIDQERCRSLANEESLEFLISHRHHPALERLYSGKKPSEIAENIFTDVLLYYTPIDKELNSEAKDAAAQFDIICAEWEKQRAAINGLLREMNECLAESPDMKPDLVPILQEYANDLFPTESEIRTYLDTILSLPPDDCISAAEAHPLQKKLLNLQRLIVKIAAISLSKGKPANNPVKEIIRQMRSQIIDQFTSLVVSCMQAGLTCSLMALIGGLQNRYLKKKRSEGILTFSDVARLSRTILLEQKDIRQSEKESFKAIMIDEFQDNNDLQKDILFLLAERLDMLGDSLPDPRDICPGKLFFVGDEKQSVYLFRGADVSVFRKLKNDLHGKELQGKELQGKALPLSINYRSAPALIGAFNTIFGGSDYDPNGKTYTPRQNASHPAGQNDKQDAKQNARHPAVFIPSGSGDMPLYEANYNPLVAGKTGDGKLAVCIFDETDSGEAESETDDETQGSSLKAVEIEARFVAGQVLALLEEKDESGKAKYQPGDIAILFRKRSPQHLFEKHLKQLGIPYANEDLGSFFFGGPVNDIMSVLRLVAYPLDKVAYAEMLRSPFAGLSLPGLSACLSAYDQCQQPFSDLQSFPDAPPPAEPFSLSEADRFKYLQGQKVYRLMCDKARRESISSLVSELWYGQGYRYETEWNREVQAYCELYDYLFHLAALADAENSGLAAFTDYIQALRDGEDKLSDLEIPLERPSAVQLLTIHKSKGLEFPVVFLCCCGYKSKGERSGAVYDSGDTGLSIAPPPPAGLAAMPNKKVKNNFFWERSKAEAEQKRTAELRRLLYVGMTRAEKELYLSGCLKMGKNDKSKQYESSQDIIAKTHIYIANQKTKQNDDDKNLFLGDSIIDDDTFFGLCLPAFASHIQDSLSGNAPAFFTLDEIPSHEGKKAISRNAASLTDNLSISPNAAFANDRAGLNAFFEKAAPFYRDATVLSTPNVKNNHLTPTSLKNLFNDERYVESTILPNAEFSGEGAGDVFAKVDSLLARFAAKEEDEANEVGEFNAGSFGTIAHKCAEALLGGKEPAMPPDFAGFLTIKESDALLEAGKKLAERFIRSPLGKMAKSAQWRESEFPFRTLLRGERGNNAGGSIVGGSIVGGDNTDGNDADNNDVFVNGVIDLMFETADTLHVLDFKTDSRENPGEHAAQLACYYRAARDLFPLKNCRIWLYYFRTGHAVEVVFSD